MSLEAIIAVGFIALIAVETAISWLHNLRAYEFRDTAANFALAFGDLLMAAAMKAVFLGLFAFLHRFAPLDMGLSWVSWALLVVINDFIYYVFHRLGHRCRFMWAFHVTHHSSQKYNFSVAVRLNLFILPLHFLFMLPLALLGFRPEAILAINSITTLYQLWVHTELVGKLGFLDRILQHAVQPSRPSRLQSAVPGPQLWRHVHILGSPVRDLRAGGRAGRVRPDQERRVAQPGDADLARDPRHAPGRHASRSLAAAVDVPVRTTRLAAPAGARIAAGAGRTPTARRRGPAHAALRGDGTSRSGGAPGRCPACAAAPLPTDPPIFRRYPGCGSAKRAPPAGALIAGRAA